MKIYTIPLSFQLSFLYHYKLLIYKAEYHTSKAMSSLVFVL